MGNPISQTDREFIWISLADAFSNGEINNHSEINDLKKFNRSEIKNIFFREVSIACGHNLLVVTPIFWDGFDQEWVKNEIKNILYRKNKSFPYRIFYELKIIFFRLFFRNIWRDVDNKLNSP